MEVADPSSLKMGHDNLNARQLSDPLESSTTQQYLVYVQAFKVILSSLTETMLGQAQRLQE